MDNITWKFYLNFDIEKLNDTKGYISPNQFEMQL